MEKDKVMPGDGTCWVWFGMVMILYRWFRKVSESDMGTMPFGERWEKTMLTYGKGNFRYGSGKSKGIGVWHNAMFIQKTSMGNRVTVAK